MNLTKKLLAGSAVAVMLLPMAASAHTGLDVSAALGGKSDGHSQGLHLGSFLGVRAGDDNHATSTRDNDNDGDHGKVMGTSTVAFHGNASTTAAHITTKANRITAIADLMASMSSTLASKISAANLSASSTTLANTKLADYNTSLTGAKAQAAAAITAAGNLNANNSTTTNATFSAQAKTDLSAAQKLLRTAAQDIHFILSLIFKAA